MRAVCVCVWELDCVHQDFFLSIENIAMYAPVYKYVYTFGCKNVHTPCDPAQKMSILETEAVRCRGHSAALRALASITQRVATRLQRIATDAVADSGPAAPPQGVNSSDTCAGVRQELAVVRQRLAGAENRCSVALRECTLDIAQQEKQLEVRARVGARVRM